MIDPKSASIATILFLLRRILQLSDDASLQNIVDALTALEGTPVALSATFSADREPSDTEKINRLLGVTPEMLRKWG